MGIRVAVAGASGYAGGELLRLIAGHPEFELVAATAHTQAGTPLSAVHPQLAGLDLTLGATDAATLSDADLVFLALPHGQSAALAAQLPAAVKIVDLGADFRLAGRRGVGEVLRRHARRHLDLRAARAARPARPDRGVRPGGEHRLLCGHDHAGAGPADRRRGGADPTDVVVVAASGTSGAGRSAKVNLLASEVMGDLSPYKVGAHQHVPEIKQATGATSLSMTPVLAPMPRGILATVTARPPGTRSAGRCCAAAYADEPFVHVLPEGAWPHTAATAGSNSCHLQATVDVDSGRIIVVSALDNLGKGAAGPGRAVRQHHVRPAGDRPGLSAYGVAP